MACTDFHLAFSALSALCAFCSSCWAATHAPFVVWNVGHVLFGWCWIPMMKGLGTSPFQDEQVDAVATWLSSIQMDKYQVLCKCFCSGLLGM